MFASLGSTRICPNTQPYVFEWRSMNVFCSGVRPLICVHVAPLSSERYTVAPLMKPDEGRP